MRLARSLLLALLLPSAAIAAPPAAPSAPKQAASVASNRAIEAAVALLSRYPAGLVPVDPGVMSAILLLGEQGTRDEVSLLRNLVDNERDEIRDAAARAIGDIRGRQRRSQREEYSQKLPDLPALEEAAQPFLDRGLGHTEAVCAAYASFVLGGLETVATSPADGDPERLLAAGRPHKALSAAMSEDSTEARLLAARAREDLGDVAGAVRGYALLAASGDADARAALDGFGVDAERMLLGMLSEPAPGHGEAEVLEVLVRHGGALTVAVLSERLDSPIASDRATATDALARMLDPDVRGEDLPITAQRDARRALAAASEQGPDPVRQLASEALKAVATETSAP